LQNPRNMPPGTTIRMWAAGDKSGKPRPPQPTAPHKRAKLPKEVRKPQKTWIRVVKWIGIGGLSLTALLVATVALIFYLYGRDPNLPDINKLSDYHPKQLIEILDANDRRIGELFGPTQPTERRTYVTYEEVPPILVDAFVAAEDNSFWEHGGVDYWGMFRAAIKNVVSRETKQGASTITQQVVKTFLLTPERTYKRKIQEIILARRLEHALTKEEIITLYMNQIYFGHGRYGVQEASRFYFGHPVSKWDPKTKTWVSQLDPGEAAMLAGLVQSPENISPRKNPKRAKERQTYVLNQLVKLRERDETGQHGLTAADAQKWIDASIHVVKEPFPELGSAPEWVQLVRSELVRDNGGNETALDTLGGKVRTTLDPGLQQIAQKALQNGLRTVDKRHGVGRAVRSLKGDKADLEIAKLAKKLPKTGPQPREMYEAVVTAVHDDDNELEVDLGQWPAALVLGGEEDARFNLPDDSGNRKKPSERFKQGDVVEVMLAPVKQQKKFDDDDAEPEPAKQAKADVQPKHGKHRVVFAPGPEGAVVIIDVKTRKVRALVGGYTSKVAGFNRATQAKRQPGSSFKPFVYATAFERTAEHPTDEPITTPSRRINDTPEKVGQYLPKNYESGKFLGPVRLRTALALSINTVSLILTEELKPETIAELARKMGIESKLPSTMSLALGSGEVTPLEMTNAIATLAAGGVAAPPRFIEAIDGKPTAAATGTQVLKPEVAYVTLDVMRSVVTEGTGHLASALKIPIAGKTGTSNDARDVWFIGLTPDYAIGVWIGYDDNRSMGHETGGTTATPVYVDIMKQINPTAKPFTRPPHVVDKTIDKESGLLAPEGAPKGTTMSEVFVEGTAPTETAAKPGDVTTDNVVTGEYGD
jgi:penicillin-binding protein 1A